MTDPALDVEAFDPDLEEDIAEAKRLARTVWPWLCGLLSGVAAALAGHQLPWPMIAVLAVLGFGTGALGYIDWRTKLILNSHNAVFGVLVLATVIVAQGAFPGTPVVLAAVLTAAGTFGVMVLLWALTGFASGGDIKVAPVIAGGLAVLSPLASSMWLLFTFLLCSFVSIAVVVRARGEQPSVPLAPFMALALPAAVLLNTVVFQSAGLLA